TKKPCILYVTQENDIDETIERLYSYYVDEDTDLKNLSLKEAMERLRNAGMNEDNIAIRIKYRPNNSITTADLDAMIDDLALEDLEVIMLIHDYIKRIRPISYIKDRHLQLGAVMD